MKPNHHSARPELVEGPFFLSTPNKKDGASTSSAQTAWESATPDSPAAPFASDATTRDARREQQHGRRGAKGQQQPAAENHSPATCPPTRRRASRTQSATQPRNPQQQRSRRTHENHPSTQMQPA